MAECKARRAKVLTRRNFLKAGAVTTVATAVVIPTWMAGGYIGRQHHIRNAYKRSEKELVKLEQLALASQEGIEFKPSHFGTFSFEEYEMVFQLSIGPHWSYEKLLSLVKKDYFPYDKHLLVADIGGSFGKAAEGLQKLEGVEAFVIDPGTELQKEGKGLPRNRFIVKKIENTGLPDESFHFMTSHNSYQYMEAPASFTEPYRLLKKGGCAIIQVQDWYDLRLLMKIKDSGLGDYIKIAYSPELGEFEQIPFIKFYNGIKDAYVNFSKEGIDPNSMMVMLEPSFIMVKI